MPRVKFEFDPVLTKADLFAQAVDKLKIDFSHLTERMVSATYPTAPIKFEFSGPNAPLSVKERFGVAPTSGGSSSYAQLQNDDGTGTIGVPLSYTTVFNDDAVQEIMRAVDRQPCMNRARDQLDIAAPEIGRHVAELFGVDASLVTVSTGRNDILAATTVFVSIEGIGAASRLVFDAQIAQLATVREIREMLEVAVRAAAATLLKPRLPGEPATPAAHASAIPTARAIDVASLDD
jgi:hypothetical protein